MKKNFKMFCQIAMVILAVFCGGFAAMAAAVPIGEAGGDTDPNAGKPLEDATNDEPNKGIDQQGHAATGSALEDLELAENKINDYVTKFRAYQYPMHTDFLKRAQQIKVTTKEPTNFEIGEAILDCNTDNAFTGGTSKVNIDLVGIVHPNDEKLFMETCTILVQGVEGYNNGVADGSPLVLFCKAKDASHIICEPLNGPLNSGVMYMPSIPAGTLLQVMAPALSESEVEVAPDAAYPDEVKYYLQKKACAITWTELFERIKKTADWNMQDIKDWQLAMFRKKCTRTMLIGAPSKRTKTNSKTGTEYVYTQKGALRQVRLGYQLNGAWTFADIIGIHKMIFGKYATSAETDVYAGPDCMENIANIDFSEHPEITIEQKLDDIGVGMTKIKSPFGTTNFKLEHALEDIGLSAYALITNMSEGKRLYYEKGKTISIDRSKGEGGEVREAKSQYYIQDDCLVIQAFNSMLVGPNIAAAGFSNIEQTVTPIAAVGDWPETPSTTVIYYITPDAGLTIGTQKVAKGLYTYDGSILVPYEGVING